MKIDLPEPLKHVRDRSIYRITKPGKYGIISDLHVPYHCKESLETACEDFRANKITGLIILGDLADMHAISRYQRDPSKRKLVKELDIVNKVLGKFREYFGPHVNIYFKEGNHDERLYSYISEKAPEFEDIPGLSIKKLYGLDEHNIQYIASKRVMSLGKLLMIHGHEYRQSQSTPVGAARWLYLKGGTTAICGHFHATSQFNFTRLDNRSVTTWSLGCMCQMDPDFAVKNGWNHGYAIVNLNTNGCFELTNKNLNTDGHKYA